jgi:hypothetical protein
MASMAAQCAFTRRAGFVAVSWRDGEEHHGPDMFDLEVFQLHLDLVAHDNSVRCASVSYDPQS